MDTAISQPIILTEKRQWVISIRGVSRALIFFLFPITPFLGLSEGLRIPLPLGDFGYYLTLSGVLNLLVCIVFLFFVYHNLKPFRYRTLLPGTLFLIAYLTMIRPSHLFDGIMDWLRVAGWIATMYLAYFVLDRGQKDLTFFFKLSLLASISPLLLFLLSYMTGQHHFGFFGEFSVDPTLASYKIRVASRSAAGYFFVLLPFGIASLILRLRRRAQIAGILFSIVSFLSAWFSYGRAIIAGIVIFWIPIFLSRRFLKLSAVTLLLIMPLMILSDWETMKLRFTDTPILKDLSYAKGEKIVAGTEEEGYWLVDPLEKTVQDWERVVIWSISLSRWWNSGIFGKIFGLGPRSLYDHGRNIFICILGEAGPIALLFFLIFLGSLIIPSWRLYRLAEVPFQKNLALLSLAVLASFLFQSMFDVPFRSFDAMWYRALLWGMVLREYRELKRRTVYAS